MSPLLFKSPLPDTINFTLKSRHSVNFSPIQTQLNIPAEEVGHRGDLVHVPTALQGVEQQQQGRNKVAAAHGKRARLEKAI